MCTAAHLYLIVSLVFYISVEILLFNIHTYIYIKKFFFLIAIFTIYRKIRTVQPTQYLYPIRF